MGFKILTIILDFVLARSRWSSIGRVTSHVSAEFKAIPWCTADQSLLVDCRKKTLKPNGLNCEWSHNDLLCQFTESCSNRLYQMTVYHCAKHDTNDTTTNVMTISQKACSTSTSTWNAMNQVFIRMSSCEIDQSIIPSLLGDQLSKAAKVNSKLIAVEIEC